jgi:putative endonuclease
MCYYVYILYSKTLDVYYKGQTRDLKDRVYRHNNSQEKATMKGVPWDLMWYTKKTTRSEAVILESKLKNLSRGRIKSFIEHHGGYVAGPDDPDR